MSGISIDVQHVSFAYEKDEDILKDISFHAEEAETIGLVGANGAGKSTLLKLLVGLYLEYTGEITVGDFPVKKETLPQIRKRISYVFQDSDNQLFMSDVYEDIAFGPRNYGLSDKEVEKQVNDAMEAVGITHLKDKPIFKLSGGEKKLASIATILSMTPDIILMDEPSIALDPQNRRNLIRILNSLPQLKIIASHDLDMILDTCPRTILLSKGRIIRDSETKAILYDQELLEENGLELPLSLYRNTLRDPGQ